MAEENRYAVTNVYKFVGSGRNNCNHAPELNQLLADAQAHKFDIIIVTRLDRFSRDFRVLVPMIADLKTTANVDVLSADGSIDTRQADWRLSLSVLTMIREHEHAALSERAKNSWAHRKAKPQGAN